jgi:hypothetical protein
MDGALEAELHYEICPMLFDYRIIKTDGYIVTDNWCYDDLDDAVSALVQIEEGKEPEGWFRHVETGRRRPGGDPSKEYINP